MKGRTGHLQTETTKIQISEAHKGKIVFQETQDKISLTLRNRIVSKETNIKLRLAMLNKIPSLETREKMKKSHSKIIFVTNIVNNETVVYKGGCFEIEYY